MLLIKLTSSFHDKDDYVGTISEADDKVTIRRH